MTHEEHEAANVAYRAVCDEIIRNAENAKQFPRSGSASVSMGNIAAYARKANTISGHRDCFGPTFMDCPEANVYRFREQVHVEEYGFIVAPVRGRGSPFMPPVKADA